MRVDTGSLFDRETYAWLSAGRQTATDWGARRAAKLASSHGRLEADEQPFDLEHDVERDGGVGGDRSRGSKPGEREPHPVGRMPEAGRRVPTRFVRKYTLNLGLFMTVGKRSNGDT